jgi:hypothetical protein
MGSAARPGGAALYDPGREQTEMSATTKTLAGCGCVAGLAFLALLAAGGGYWYWTTTPQYSLEQARRAFQTHDLAAFDKYVDVDSLVETGIDALAAEASREGAGGAVGAAVALLFRGRLAAELETQVRRSVEKGADFEGRDPRRTTFEIGDVRRDGKVAVARVVAQTQRGAVAERLELQLKLRDKGSYWQVFEIANLPELWRAAREHEMQAEPAQ